MKQNNAEFHSDQGSIEYLPLQREPLRMRTILAAGSLLYAACSIISPDAADKAIGLPATFYNETYQFISGMPDMPESDPDPAVPYNYAPNAASDPASFDMSGGYGVPVIITEQPSPQVIG